MLNSGLSGIVVDGHCLPLLCVSTFHYLMLHDITVHDETSHTFLLCIYILASIKILETVMIWNKANPCAVAASLLETKIPYPTLQQLSNTHTFLGSLILSSPIYNNLPSQGNLSIQRCLCFLCFLHQQIKALSFLSMKNKLHS